MTSLSYITRKQLETLVAIVDTGNLTRAAEHLNITAPAVSMALKTLENQVGAETIRRGNDGKILLNPIGQKLYDLAKRLEIQISCAERDIDAFKSGKAGLVTIGAVSTAKYLFPRIIKLAQDAYPDIEIDLCVGNRREIILQLERSEIDFAIMGRPPSEPPVSFEEIAPHNHVIIAPADFAKPQNLEELAHHKFLVREEGSGTRILFEWFVSQNPKMQPIRRTVLNSNETIKQAVMAGLGIALISEATVELEIKHSLLKTVNFDGFPISRSWYSVWRQDRIASAAALAVQKFIAENIPSLIDSSKH